MVPAGRRAREPGACAPWLRLSDQCTLGDGVRSFLPCPRRERPLERPCVTVRVAQLPGDGGQTLRGGARRERLGEGVE